MVRAAFYSLVVLVLVWVGWHFYQKGSLPIVGEALTDAKATAAITAAFSLHDRLSGRPIRVRARHGAVTLSGEVASESERSAAEEIAANVVGVISIENRLRVAPELEQSDRKTDRTLGQRLDDAALNAKVRAALALHRDLAGLELSVEAREGTVSLKGTVNRPEQIETCRRWVLGIEGVERVVTSLRVKAEKESIDRLER